MKLADIGARDHFSKWRNLGVDQKDFLWLHKADLIWYDVPWQSYCFLNV